MMGLGFAGGVEQSFMDRLAGSGASPLLLRVQRLLDERGATGYLVGGFVRDALLERATGDIDIAVTGDACHLARHVAGALGGTYVLLDADNLVARVVLAADAAEDGRPWQIDFSSIEADLEKDLARRDFTVNAMAVDLAQLKCDPADVRLIDPFGGRADVDRRLVRSVAEGVFEADPVRLLRAVRLAAELGFSIEDSTQALMERDAPLASGVAGERVREELLRLLDVPGSGRFLTYLHRVGLLLALVPELAQAADTEQPPEHHWKVLDHSLMTAAAVDYVLHEGPWEHAGDWALESVPWSAEIADHFRRGVGGACTGAALLRLAAMLHDVAKPRTRSIEADGRMRFLGHPQEGASMAAAIMERLRFSGREIGAVETMVRNHLRPVQMSPQGVPSARAVYRFFRDTAESGIDILFLSLADHLATRGPLLDPDGWREHTGIVERALARRVEEQARPGQVKLVDGHDLMDVFGLQPGPQLGGLLEAVREARAAGEIGTRQEALDHVRNLIQTEGKS
jgi:poly(A) polymerase